MEKEASFSILQNNELQHLDLYDDCDPDFVLGQQLISQSVPFES